ncbi:PREDICTED: ubiquitin carboxyl-terminal hydrolase MINDY-1-like [Lupinus angustifolius]|uniref:ubiquitin carboxyl-terminal hydrolase MINDY-1-like n=1 Tax=Lupinus angustifolius TaxID=3871 RepID=UPI00092F8C80|nr:PREDICTED: ubiquitin carboxyl-terminal hydrolase MINDY-1-like [Lupinus angustifolius]
MLSLVAERLLDSNTNLNNKNVGYVENQQQNIAVAIDLLPRLATGIDVNFKFRRIDDFEFTRECAIFDLLDIPLYHGWIVDPQDYDTANAIESKSYNTLMGEREICVFLQNNHFSTMFKFEGVLYVLATDQGYINQPDLVWEKLNEVNHFLYGLFASRSS